MTGQALPAIMLRSCCNTHMLTPPRVSFLLHVTTYNEHPRASAYLTFMPLLRGAGVGSKDDYIELIGRDMHSEALCGCAAPHRSSELSHAGKAGGPITAFRLFTIVAVSAHAGVDLQRQMWLDARQLESSVARRRQPQRAAEELHGVRAEALIVPGPGWLRSEVRHELHGAAPQPCELHAQRGEATREQRSRSRPSYHLLICGGKSGMSTCQQSR